MRKTKYIIYGLGISGISAVKFLAAADNCEVIATDDNSTSIQKAKEEFAQTSSSLLSKIKFLPVEEIEFDKSCLISFAPGIPLYFPIQHKILEICKKTGAELACDIEIFYRKNLLNKFLAITGTNGKSTTTALCGFIFDQLKIPSAIGGNIGVPCFDLPKNQKNFTYIFETSSYQLDLLSQTHFKISALLNITPDHIDRHGSLENYIAAKKRIFRNQTEQDFAIIDVDNKNSLNVFNELKNDTNFKATLVPISTKNIQSNGLSLINGKLSNQISKKSFEVELKSKFLLGEHNEQNMAFAFAITYCHFLQENEKLAELTTSTLYDVQEKIATVIKKFYGLRHRMQIVGEINNIRFINDSKATNAESTQNALKAYENIFWIVGGKAKEGGISSLQPYFKKIVKAFLIGESSEEFAKVLEKNSVSFERCGDLRTAFKKSFEEAKIISLSESNILLSPACASFDQWKNFEQRGDYFCKLFDDLPKL